MSKRVEQQLRRLGITPERAPSDEQWALFLRAVDLSYGSFERRGEMLERSLNVSARETETLNRELQRTAELQIAEHAALSRVATAVASSVSPDQVAQLVAEQIVAITGLKVGLVVRFEAGEACVVGAVGPGTEVGLRWTPSPSGPLREVQATGQPVMRRAPDLRGREADWIAAPVMVDGSPWGAITAIAGGCDAGQCGERLASFAHLVGLAIENAEAHRRLAEQAARDPLTGLYNHRIFHEALERSMSMARRDDRPMALILFDIDYFKLVNDNHGHRTGDEVLRDLTQRLRGLVRGGDTVARVGGEEFGWIVANADGAQALAAAERLREVVQEAPFGVAGRITISAGICDRSQADDIESMYRFADGALYWAKEHGRDRCVLYRPDVVASLSVREEAERQRRTQSMASVRALARAVDARDSTTHRHSERVSRNACRLAEVAGWASDDIERLREAGVLHDIGKIGISDEVLLKRGSLDEAEREIVSRHCELGAAIASGLLDDEQLSWIRGHHERWDAGGYPDGLRGDEIPEGAQLLAIADALDAMLHDRSYRKSMVIERALLEIHLGCGTQFAPNAVVMLDRLIERDGKESLIEPPAPAIAVGGRALEVPVTA